VEVKAARGDGTMAEGVIRLQDKPKRRLRSRSSRRFPCGTPGCCQRYGNMADCLRAGFGEQGRAAQAKAYGCH
jgi:hypothetical protein